MASVNKVILLGNLGSDPELRYTPSGKAVANFSLATHEVSERNGTGLWHGRVSVKYAENICTKEARSTSKGGSRQGPGMIETEINDTRQKSLPKVCKCSERQARGASFPNEEPISIPDDDIPF